MKKSIIKFLNFVLFILSLIFIWWIIFKLNFWPSWIFPSPVEVFNKLFKNFQNFSFTLGILMSLKRLFIGYLISLLLGTLFGFIIAQTKYTQELFRPLILGIQTLPSICWLPLAILWFGLNEQAIIFVVVMGTILSITISVLESIVNVPRMYIKAGMMLGTNNGQIYRYIIFPAILPSYLSAAKQGWAFAWRSLMSGEMLFITVGLGQLLMLGRELNDMAQVISVMLIIILIGVFFEQLIFSKIERRLKNKWGLSN